MHLLARKSEKISVLVQNVRVVVVGDVRWRESRKVRLSLTLVITVVA